MQQRRFDQLDVFSAQPLMGNPLAVVHAAQGLGTETMAAFARWTNLSETTFLLLPTAAAAAAGADYRVRIFTPFEELPFAGHPTLGSCHAWLAAGGTPRDAGMVVQECGVGLVRIRRTGQQLQRLAFAAPPVRRSGPLDAGLLARIVAGVGLQAADVQQHQWVDNGPGWCAVLLRSAAQVLAVRPDWGVLGDVRLGLVGAQPAGHETAFELRALIGTGRFEDPVTGSLNASVAQWLIGAGLAPRSYVAAQGSVLGRAGRVYLEQTSGNGENSGNSGNSSNSGNADDNTVWVGGDVASCISGTVTLA